MKNIVLTNDNVHDYEYEIADYAFYNLGFCDNNHIDSLEVKGENVIIDGVFRECEVPEEDWEQYEEDDFPNDVDQLTVEKQKLED